MMQAFRNSAKPVVVILSIAFFGWLVFDLSGLSGGSGLLTRTSVGKINGRTIDARLFQEAVQRATEVQQRQSPSPLGVADQAQIRDQVWEQFIQSTILDQEYRRRGLQVSASEIADAIRNVPPQEIRSVPTFLTDGQFDMSKYQAWLGTAEGMSYVPVLEAQYRDEILRSKLVQDLISTLYVSDAQLWRQYRDANDSVSVELATIDPLGVIPDADAPVTDAEVESWFRSHRDDFRRERTAFLSFIAVDKQVNAADTAAALARAESLRAEIQNGAPFAEVAQRESSDTVSGSRGGDLGEWTRNTFDPAFEAAAFRLPLNTVSEPVLTPFGYHLIEITSRKGDTISGRHILAPIELSGAHRDLVDARADSLEQLAADRLDRAALDTAARALSLPIIESGPVVEGGFAPVHIDATIWAFQAKRHEHSPVFEAPASYLVYRVDSLWPAGVPALGSIRSDVIAAVRADKKRVQARRLGDSLASRVQAGKSLREAATELGIPVESMGPFTRYTAQFQSGLALGTAFGLEPGRTSGPIEEANRYFLVQVRERWSADSARFAGSLDSLRTSTLQSVRQNYVQRYFADLRSRAVLADYRSELYRTSAQNEALAPPTPAPAY